MNHTCHILSFAFCASGLLVHANDLDKPNILFVISDDQSFPYASAYGTTWVKTPGFDRVHKKEFCSSMPL